MAEQETIEPQAKRQRLISDVLKVHVVDLGGKEFDLDVDGGEFVIDVKRKILEELGYQLRLPEIRLILGADELEDRAVLSETSAKDGDSLTVVKHVGIMELIVARISDDTQWHGKHKFAIRSEPLLDEVEKIEVTVGDFQDQGWGGCQARLFIYLHNFKDDTVVASMKIFGPLRTAEYDERKYGRSPSCTIGEEQPVVALAKTGMVYKLKYQCGGGGGHSITVKDWCCKIFPKSRSTDDVTITVNGIVNLVNSSRLGPDRTTGKWELEEPPYP
eukprot:CAMPEP_0117578180 /NCGR_PEP_ID=MMETSP0784-20121206/63851_1 /TAXON_ID=39447 /ORGANISM="" /LENGTH=272 /DNA_ID=CAMNT_0005377797 /DNA_START=87 /DNA_END=905 /DNA_ORIENTATION=+